MSVITTEQTPQGIVVRETLVPRKYEATTAALAPTTPFRDPYTILVDENGKLWVWNGTAYVQEAGGAGGATVDQSARNAAAAAANLAALANQKGEDALIAVQPAGVASSIGNMTDAQKGSIVILTDKYRGVFRPEEAGAKGDAWGGANARVNGDKLLVQNRPFTSDEVGRTIYIEPNTGPYTINSVDGNGEATLSRAVPVWAETGSAFAQAWQVGTDDTVAVQAAIDAAADYRGIYPTAGNDTQDQHIRTGGVVELKAGRYYGIFNSSGAFSGGKRAALIQKRRSTIRGAGMSRSGFIGLGGMYGSMIANAADTDYHDFSALRDLSLHCFGLLSPNQLDGYQLRIASGSDFGATDAFNRIEGVMVRQAARHGMFLGGRGELKVVNCMTHKNGGNGYRLEDQYDWEMVASNAGGNGLTGMYIFRSGAGNINGGKSYYNGNRGTVAIENANLTIHGDDERHGMVFVSGLQLQESFGSSAVITTGHNIFEGVQFLDPGRTDITAQGGTRPAVMAGVHLSGPGCIGNIFSACLVSSSVILWTGKNWPDNVYGVYVDDWTNGAGGPQNNAGDIYTRQPFLLPGGATRVGNQYGGTGAKVRNGAGSKNQGLRIDGVPLT